MFIFILVLILIPRFNIQMEPTDAETASSVDVPYQISSEQHISIVNTSKKIIINLGNK